MGDVGSLAIGGAMAGLALLTHTILLLPILGGLYVVETLIVIAQVVSFRVLPPARAAHGADPPPLRGRGLARVHRDRALLAARGPRRRGGPRHLLRRLHPHPRGARLMRVLVVGLAATGMAVVDVRARRRRRRDRRRGPSRRGRLRPRAAARGEPPARPCSRRPIAAVRTDAVTRRRSGRPEPGRASRPSRPSSRPVPPASPVRSEIDLAAERLRAVPDAPRLVAVTGTNGKTTVTTLDRRDAHGVRCAGDRRRQHRPPAASTPSTTTVDVVVAEVSSFQLEFTTDAFAPDVAVLLNVAGRPPRLARHARRRTRRRRRRCSRTNGPTTW